MENSRQWTNQFHDNMENYIRVRDLSISIQSELSFVRKQIYSHSYNANDHIISLWFTKSFNSTTNWTSTYVYEDLYGMKYDVCNV